jgi:hypothetical protein
VSSEDEIGKSSSLIRSTSAGTALSGKKAPVKSSLSVNKLEKDAHPSTSELDDDPDLDEIQPWENDETLETNVLEESTNRLDISKIVNNLDKFVLGIFFIL